MSASSSVILANVQERAQRTGGTSASAIYAIVAESLSTRHGGGGVLLDVGCGVGNLWPYLRGRFDRYLGADILKYEGFPDEGDFLTANLDSSGLPLPAGAAEVVVAVETIEHLENPRAFFRELVRLAQPGGWVVVTTPNQLSVLSKLTLVLKNQFNAFQASSYPAHLTALLEVDLRRMAAECRLTDVAVLYSRQGRVPGTPWHYPGFLSRLFPRAMSDNVLLIGRTTRG
jgi:2-polyprenyl-3-methyl-5-hydroxy-6-metoxy-1,4-benzoquinol methylase